jgi:two-component system, cell cycle response regulator
MDKRPPKQTILVVDDIPDNIDVLRGILHPEYRVKAALSGEHALGIAASNDPPDLILLDIMMPKMDGYEVCRRLKANSATVKIPVIFVTARDQVMEEAKGFTLGAVDYITKPVSSAVVLARVRTQLALYDQNRVLESLVRQRTTQLRHSLERVEQERARFNWVVQQADEGYAIVDELGRLQYTNPQARLYLGLPPADPEESAGGASSGGCSPSAETFLEVVRRQYHLESQEAWSTPITEAKSQRPRYLVRPESSMAKELWLQVEVLDIAKGPEPGWLICLREVTDQVKSWQAKQAFTSMIYHKMRTPLVGMVGGLDLLARHGTKLSPREITETAELALKGVERLSGAIEDILTYLDAPGLPEPGEGFCLAQLQSVVAEISAGLRLDKVSITCPAHLRDDQVALSQRAMELILWELMDNAKKFHPKEDPVVELRASRPQPGEISLEILDDGVTVLPEHLSAFWTPYYQAERQLTGEVPGMGLGLATVASLVWRVGGSCQAYRRRNGPGLVVQLRLPLQEKQEPEGYPP